MVSKFDSLFERTDDGHDRFQCRVRFRNRKDARNHRRDSLQAVRCLRTTSAPQTLNNCHRDASGDLHLDRSRSKQKFPASVLAESQGHNRSYQIFQVGYQAKLKTRCQPRDTSTCFGAVTQMSARATDLRYELRC